MSLVEKKKTISRYLTGKNSRLFLVSYKFVLVQGSGSLMQVSEAQHAKPHMAPIRDILMIYFFNWTFPDLSARRVTCAISWSKNQLNFNKRLLTGCLENNRQGHLCQVWTDRCSHWKINKCLDAIYLLQGNALHVVWTFSFMTTTFKQVLHQQHTVRNERPWLISYDR